jgi:hypothetical protein
MFCELLLCKSKLKNMKNKMKINQAEGNEQGKRRRERERWGESASEQAKKYERMESLKCN